MKIENEKEVKAFFARMKENDEEVRIPDFPPIAERKKQRWWLPIGIAAALLCGFWFAGEVPQDTELHNDLVIIRLVEDENKEQKFIIETASSIDVWEPPTSSLLTDY